MNQNKTQLKQFKRVQNNPLLQEFFDDIQSFPECGGIAVFMGTVRNHHNGKQVKSLQYTAYVPLAEKLIRQIEIEVQKNLVFLIYEWYTE